MVPFRARMIVTGTVAALAVTLAGPLMPHAAASGDHSAPAASRSQAAFADAAVESGVPEPLLLALP